MRICKIVIDFKHDSVLLEEAVNLLNINENGIYIDGTAGGGGHSSEILRRLSLKGRLICFDKDPDAISHINYIFGNINNVTIIKSDFRYIPNKLDELGIDKVDGILLDLGVSSYQIDNPERGFCYSKNAILDMRMSKNGLSAYDIVNEYSVDKLAKIICSYGEEKFGFRIAKNIEKFRNNKPIQTTYELNEIIRNSIPLSVKYKKNSNSLYKKTFQAIRIAVNDELDSLSECIDNSFKKLSVRGRFCIITFHSIEDRIVKHKFCQLTKGCVCPPNFPVCICNQKPVAKFVNKKPILPSNEELNTNKRSKSAKLRVIEKLC